MIINFDDEEELWTSGALENSNQRQLVNILIYLLGLHRALKFGERSQLKIEFVDKDEVL